MATPAVFNPTPATIIEHPACEKCGECLVCSDPHACPAARELDRPEPTDDAA